MAYLFDTDAISEAMRPRPLTRYLDWLQSVPREDQFTSAVCIGELYHGALRAQNSKRHLEYLQNRLLPAITVLPFDVAIAREYGRLRAELQSTGQPLADADLQIAATAAYHQLELVTGNLRHFDRIPGLTIQRVLIEARQTADPGR